MNNFIMLCQISTKEFRKKGFHVEQTAISCESSVCLFHILLFFLRHRETLVPASWIAFQMLFAIFYLQTEH